MNKIFPRRLSSGSRATFNARLSWRCCVAVCFALIAVTATHGQSTTQPPVMLSEAASTRAIALDAVNFRREPFSFRQPIQFGTDDRTRVMLFVMNLGLYEGEGANAVTVDAEDGLKRRFPLTVEYVGNVRGFEWMTAVVVRLHDDMEDAGDVLVRVGAHGTASNRVRLAVGHVGGGLPDDQGAVPTPAPSTPPAPTPTLTPNPYTSPSTARDTARFLEQTSFGMTPSAYAAALNKSFRQQLQEQFDAPMTDYPNLAPQPSNSMDGCPTGSAATCYRDNYTQFPLQVRFFQNALSGQDQLRQRVAFALSQILVTSGIDVQQPSSMAVYQRLLLRNSFGNFRTLISEVTLNPAMGRYLDMVNNVKPNPARGTEPNENYARELLQLFTIGLYKLNQDGTLQLDASGQPIPTYDQEAVEGFAHVFTGWTYAPMPGVAPHAINPSYYMLPMVATESNHDTAAKEVLNGVVIPAGQTAQKDLDDALDNIFNHPNVAPFIGRRLIQSLVTSNPSPAYVARVSAAFNNNGAGVRGDMKAVITAILLDPEARGDYKTAPNYGHLREPALYVMSILRAFSASSDGVGLITQTSGMGQNVFYSGSVFNYYSPLYNLPNERGLTAPEFNIQTTATALARANFVNTIVYSRINAQADVPGSTGTSINFTPWEQYAADPQQLINQLDTFLMHNSMSPAMRAVLTQAITSVPATNPNARVKTAVYLVLTSSQFQVEQ